MAVNLVRWASSAASWQWQRHSWSSLDDLLSSAVADSKAPEAWSIVSLSWERSSMTSEDDFSGAQAERLLYFQELCQAETQASQAGAFRNRDRPAWPQLEFFLVLSFEFGDRFQNTLWLLAFSMGGAHKLLPSVGHLLRHRFWFQDCRRVLPFANRREAVARRRRTLLWPSRFSQGQDDNYKHDFPFQFCKVTWFIDVILQEHQNFNKKQFATVWIQIMNNLYLFSWRHSE